MASERFRELDRHHPDTVATREALLSRQTEPSDCPDAKSFGNELDNIISLMKLGDLPSEGPAESADDAGAWHTPESSQS